MGMQNGSADSNKFKDAYFTKPSDVDWCYKKLEALYGDLTGKTALEPACGSGVFVKAAPQMVWITNELFPEFSQGMTHDFGLDFAKGDRSVLGTYDFVIGNPPYGKASNLARKFLLNALEHSSVVAMVLPKALRRHTQWDKYVPADCKVVCEEDLPTQSFDLPDGSTKEVGTFFLVVERQDGYDRGLMCEYEPEGYKIFNRRYCKEERASEEEWWFDWATYGLVIWGSCGKFFGRERTKPFASVMMFDFTDEQAEIVAKIDWEPLIARTKTSVPALSAPEVITAVNRALRCYS